MSGEIANGQSPIADGQEPDAPARSVPISATVRLVNGRLITRANMHRLRLKSSRLCTNHMHSRIDPKTYKETWIVVRGREGFAWREITHGAGVCGFQPTLRKLILATLCNGLFGPRTDYELTLADDLLDIEAVQRGWDANEARIAAMYPALKERGGSYGGAVAGKAVAA